MRDTSAILPAVRRGPLVVLVASGAALAAGLVWSAERRSADLREEVSWLRARLSEKRALIAQQRQEMAEVATAVERLSRTTGAVRERAAQARHLAHMEESRDSSYDLLPVKATLDGGMSIVSEDAARALEELSWLDGQTAATGDSMAVLTALLRERPDDGQRRDGGEQRGVPSFWPVRGFVTSHFGARRSPYGEDHEMHPGIDISARYGVPVGAGGDGKVIFAGRDSGYGGLVVIEHSSHVDTLYAHLSAIYVREAQAVRRGQPIGAIGASGRATGAHLHYEVRVRGTPVDPQRFLVN